MIPLPYLAGAFVAFVCLTIYRAGGIFPVLYWIYRSPLGYLYYRHWYLTNRLEEEPHSDTCVHSLGGDIDVVTLALLDSNFCYIILQSDSDGKVAAVVIDPSEGPAVLDELTKRNVSTVLAVLNTHHHWDHVGGNVDIKRKFPEASVMCGEAVRSLTKLVKHGDMLLFGRVLIEVYKVPCHTSDHVIYLCSEDATSPRSAEMTGRARAPLAVFTGDTLFAAGCGKFFEGGANDMYNALHKTIAFLPDQTMVFPGHEYTVSNLHFALSVEPNNVAAQDKLSWSRKQREAGKVTVPTTIAEEKAYNPFMRVHEEAARRRTKKIDPIEVMQGLRDLRDRFIYSADLQIGS